MAMLLPASFGASRRMNDSHDIRKNLRFRNAELAQEHPTEGSTNEWGYLKIKPQNKIKIVDAKWLLFNWTLKIGAYMLQ